VDNIDKMRGGKNSRTYLCVNLSLYMEVRLGGMCQPSLWID